MYMYSLYSRAVSVNAYRIHCIYTVHAYAHTYTHTHTHTHAHTHTHTYTGSTPAPGSLYNPSSKFLVEKEEKPVIPTITPPTKRPPVRKQGD